jgi:low temperature requirement protein LtrA
MVLAREREERKTSWLELFYDLIFVALVSQLTHALADDPSHLLRFSTLYLIIWRSWHGPTMFSYVAFKKSISVPEAYN